MQKRATLRDIAQAAGVSIATVDRVLNNRETVRQSTALQVLEIARQLGFHAVPLLEQRVHGTPERLTLGLVLLSTDPDFYHKFRDEAEAAARAETRMSVRLRIEFTANNSPAEAVAALERLGSKVQAIGMIAVDHPRVTQAVTDLRAKGIPVFSILSDFAQSARAAYLGTNNLKVGRSAAFMLGRGVPRDSGAVIALFVGGHLWHGHDLRETGFRSYIRRERPDITLLDTQINLDTDDLAYEATVALLGRYKQLRGIYCCGGGLGGVVRAVKEEGRIGHCDVVANELTDFTRRALADGVVSMVIETPIDDICRTFFAEALAAVKQGPSAGQSQHFVQMRLVLPESV